MVTPKIEQLVTFGPFRMPHLQAHVDDRMHQAFYSYLAQKVLPLLEGKITRIDGRFHSHYDQPQFADLAEVRHRYYYEVKLFSAEGHEEACGELDYNALTASFTPNHIKPPGVKILSEIRKTEAAEKALRDFRHRYRHHPGDECPQCHSRRIAYIVYGTLSIPLSLSVAAELEAGTIRLGSGSIGPDSPIWLCLSCESAWGFSPLSDPDYFSKWLRRQSGDA